MRRISKYILSVSGLLKIGGLFLPLFLFSSYAGNYTLQGKVIKITDGDTINLLLGNYQQRKIRLYGIDAPEKSQPFGKKSKQMLAQMVARKKVTAECIGNDRYGRDICVIWTDNKDINGLMVLHGGAWVYRKYYKGNTYYQYEREAKRKHIGLWSTSEARAIPPWQWRHRKPQNSLSNSSGPAVKLSRNNICHAKGTKYYNRVKHYRSYQTISECLQFGRLPRG